MVGWMDRGMDKYICLIQYNKKMSAYIQGKDLVKGILRLVKVCVHVCVYKYTYVYIHIIYLCMYTYIYMYICIYTYNIHIHVCVYICTRKEKCKTKMSEKSTIYILYLFSRNITGL